MEKRAVKYHRGRLGEALREEIETLVEGELADPRIGLVRVTAVHVADDGRSAQVLVDVDGDELFKIKHRMEKNDHYKVVLECYMLEIYKSNLEDSLFPK